MLKQYAFKNYKAFAEGEIEIKPITILLGANSTGKSSLIQLLLMMLQTFGNETAETVLRLNGRYVSLGEGENILHKKMTSKSLNFSFTFESESLQSSLETLTSHFVRTINWAFRDFISYAKTLYTTESETLKELRRQEQLWSSYYNQYVENRNPNYSSLTGILFIQGIVNRLSEIFAVIEEKKERVGAPRDRSLNFFRYELDDINPEKLNEVLEMIKRLSDIQIGEYNVEFEFRYNRTHSTFVISRQAIYVSGKLLIEYRRQLGQKRAALRSQIFSNRLLLKYSQEFHERTEYSGLSLNVKESRQYQWSADLNLDFNVVSLVHGFFQAAQIDLENAFQPEAISYVNPLRASPRRYYFINEANRAGLFNSIDGNNVTEILKGNSEIKTNVNKWLKRFGLSVSVEALRDIIHKLKVHQNGLNLDIVDVGFGISQVLPVIIQGFLSDVGSVILIEQPEIHLHPKMQAELADLFIDMVSNEQKRIVIETHSEYLLQRLKRRISEGRVQAENVAIYFVHSRVKKDTSTRIERLKVDDKGGFDFPEEFYSTFMEDTSEFIKNQV